MNAFLPLDEVLFALACAPTVIPGRSGLCLAGGQNGLYVSNNAGQSWRNRYDRLGLQAVLPTVAVQFSPAYAEDHALFAAVAGNVFRSEDDGESWNGVYIANPLPTITALGVSPAFLEDGLLFAATMEDGVFASYNRGETWRSANFGLLDLNVLTLALSPHFAHSPILLAGVESGIFRSHNGGRAWREVALPCGYEPVLSLTMGTHNAYAGTETQGVFTSADNGVSWSALPTDGLSGAVNGVWAATDTTPAALDEDGLKIYAAEQYAWLPWHEQATVGAPTAAALWLDGETAFALLAGEGGQIAWVKQA